MAATLAFGMTAAPRPGQERLAPALEELGYEELWVNDTRRGDGLATLAGVAPTARTLRFGVGVVALSEQSPSRIAERVAGAGLPDGRLTLGVGSGSSSSLELVRDGVAELRRLLPEVPIAVAAVGPRMATLAGEVADAVVANWALPERLAWLRARVDEGAQVAGRASPRLVAYVRTAVGRGASDRLRAEMARYRGFGRHYERALGAQHADLIGLAGGGPPEIAAGLARYREVVDTLVVRALPAEDGIDAWLEVAAAASARRHDGTAAP